MNQLIIDVLLSLKVVCMQSCQYLLSLGLKKVIGYVVCFKHGEFSLIALPLLSLYSKKRE